jgi:hypothetical protein
MGLELVTQYTPSNYLGILDSSVRFPLAAILTVDQTTRIKMGARVPPLATVPKCSDVACECCGGMVPYTYRHRDREICIVCWHDADPRKWLFPIVLAVGVIGLVIAAIAAF